jgi:hypothetical protein
MGLNTYQQNALEVRMRLLERTLFQIRQSLHMPPVGRLTHFRPLAPATGAQVEALIGAMLAEIAAVAEQFNLQPETEDMAQTIRAEMTIAWADLRDTLPAKLKAYGEVDPALSETLEPHIVRLISLAEAVQQAAKGGT